MSNDFLWGAATSSHQVEGNNVHNNWWQWEMRRPIKFRSGQAISHYDLYQTDFALAKKLGHNAHRFSLEWSRIEPKQGKWDKTALTHYRDVLTELHRLNIKPIVTLYHFTLPQWLSAAGGWLLSDTPRLFARYVKVVAQHFGDLVDIWVTINEPVVYSTMSYWHQRWPPQRKNLFQLDHVLHHLAIAHKRAYRVIHRLQPTAQVGLAKHMINYRSAQNNWLNNLATKACHHWFNRRFLNLTWPYQDYIGVNYYFQTDVTLRLTPPFLHLTGKGEPRSDIGWHIAPDGLYGVLLSLKSYQLPVYIMENGLADSQDKLRADFIRDHLRAVERAQQAGINIKGYFYWSLLDNFEWDLGFKPRFGLIGINYKTMARQPRPSAWVYKAIIASARETKTTPPWLPR